MAGNSVRRRGRPPGTIKRSQDKSLEVIISDDEDNVDEDAGQAAGSNLSSASSDLSSLQDSDFELPENPLDATPQLLKALDESLKNSAAKRKNISEKDSSNTKDMDIDEERTTEPRKRAKTNKETTAVIAKTKPPPAPVKIDFVISLQKLDQLNKLATKRKPFGVRSFDLERTDDWDALKLELIKITETSFPNKLIDLEQYEISYTIPRKSSDPVPLLNEQDFLTILSLTKSSKSPLVNIYVCERKPQKENNDSSSDSDSSSSSSEDRTSKRKASDHSKKKKKKKEDKTKEDPMNIALTAKVKLLQETHKCSDNDGSDYCFWTEADREHRPLSKTMLRSWGEALLKEDDDIATIKKPPNNQHFDRFNTEKGRISPLLEKRLNNARHSSAVPTIINQIHMPAEFIPQ
ncbi:hypothetical protein C8J55DRAFT_501129 [Lentinula edodes]|uniref:Uncharacterized protein n=1 Tax=Lentinula lateritia TaxID=40482 RepID=A0A9W9DZ41_9AGAR|nr:hypothetical protein C8J55DRAFT_501129 [Lentinula edodes]